MMISVSGTERPASLGKTQLCRVVGSRVHEARSCRYATAEMRAREPAPDKHETRVNLTQGARQFSKTAHGRWQREIPGRRQQGEA